MPELEELHTKNHKLEELEHPKMHNDDCGASHSPFSLGVSGPVECLAKLGRNDAPSDSKSKLCCFFDRRGPSCSVIQSDQICIVSRVERT